jgi:hypothetical protein
MKAELMKTCNQPARNSRIVIGILDVHSSRLESSRGRPRLVSVVGKRQLFLSLIDCIHSLEIFCNEANRLLVVAGALKEDVSMITRLSFRYLETFPNLLLRLPPHIKLTKQDSRGSFEHTIVLHLGELLTRKADVIVTSSAHQQLLRSPSRSIFSTSLSSTKTCHSKQPC